MAHITLDWKWIYWKYNFTWSKDIQPQLAEHALDDELLRRAVYVIRLNPPFAIKYPNKTSPVLYIGEGHLKARLSSHTKEWIPSLWEIVENQGLTIGIATPRVRNNEQAYKDVEARLLQEFTILHGSAPLNNKRSEYQKIIHSYDSNQLREPLLLGKGLRYKWEITPMKSNTFYDAFRQTHQ